MKYLLFVLFLTACTSQLPWANTKPLEKKALETPTIINAVAARMSDSATVVHSIARITHGKTSCQNGPMPLWIPATNLGPLEGRWFRLGWTIEAVARPAPSRHSVAVLVSFRPLSDKLELTRFGLPGCWLLTHPDYILSASQNPDDVFYYDPSTGLGYIQFLPAIGMRGTTMYMQLVITDAQGKSKLSPLLELIVGT